MHIRDTLRMLLGRRTEAERIQHEALAKMAHYHFDALNAAAKELGIQPLDLKMGSRQFAVAAAFIALTAAQRSPRYPSP